MYSDPGWGGIRVECRKDCGACCIAPSITSALPGAPDGKPAGMVCPHLDHDKRCLLFGDPVRPYFCASLQPSADMCGNNREEALSLITAMEDATNPASP
ncbi:MAG: YkgJ family cysteine cluster protein [Spirochaetota bacterium]